jgi:hypothetical protein
MRKWKHRIEFRHFWDNDEISIEEKGKLASKAIKRLEKHLTEDEWYDLEEIAEQFENVSDSDDDDFTVEDDFNARMSDLYDWADSNDVWVSTRF